MLAMILLVIAGVYLLVGAVFACWFVFRALDRFDSAAHGAGIAFRLILLPGAIALWPCLLVAMKQQEGAA